MDIMTLMLLGVIVAALPIVGFFLLIFLAILIYVVKNIYPPVRRMALWAAKIDNFLPLLILDVVLVFLIIVIVVVALKSPAIVVLLLILLGIILVVVLVLVAVLLELAILVYVIRFVWWLYTRWQGLLGGLLPQIMRLRIKHDVGKDKGTGTGTGKDWTTHFAEMRKRLSEEAELARRRISKGGK